MTGSLFQATPLMRTIDVSLATLAARLASAVESGCNGVATGARRLARAAARSGLIVHDFFD